MAGNITINKPKDNYQRVPKAVIFDQGIDALSLGIYVKVLCLGRKWKLNIRQLAKVLGVSLTKVQRSFALLEERGFVRRVHVKNEAGRFTGYDYEVGIDLIGNQQQENSIAGENQPLENQPLENEPLYNRDYKENRKEEEKFINPLSRKDNISAGGREFDFYEALRGLGVSEETAEDWRKVRRSLKACDTRTAFNLIAEEIARAGKSAEDCVRLAAANSWRGFRAAWIREENSPRPSYPTGERRRLSNYEKALIAQDEEFGTHAYQDFCHEREERRRAQAAAGQPDDQ